MAEHEMTHEERQRAAQIRAERRADIREALKEELPRALKEELPKMMVAMLWGDMRPPRTWEEIRTHLEDGIKASERRDARGKFLRNAAGDTIGQIIRDVVMHLLFSIGAVAAILQFILHIGRGS